MIPFEVAQNLLRRSYAKTQANLQHNMAMQYASIDAFTLGYAVASDLQIALAEGIPNPEFRKQLAEGLQAGILTAACADLNEDSLPEVMG